MNKPFSQSCEKNKHPILDQLRILLSRVNSVLEIGTGTGQHAVFFAGNLPHIEWHTSDLVENHEGIQQWIDESSLQNVHSPIVFEIGQDTWPIEVGAVFTANTTHIMAPDLARKMMIEVAKHLPKGGVFCQYGPFNQHGEYSSDSNRKFDQWLTDRHYGGIRDIDELTLWADAAVMSLEHRINMPSNNQLLVWRKR